VASALSASTTLTEFRRVRLIHKTLVRAQHCSPKIDATKLKDFNPTDAERFFLDVATMLGKSSMQNLKSTLRRSIRRAQKHDLIGRNVAELVDLPQAGRGGRRGP
jgi:hypothetical protein